MTHLKRKLMMTLALLLTAATGAWATDYTTLAVGDVIKVGDKFSPTSESEGAFNDFGVDNGTTYKLIRADVDNEYYVTEETDGAYYVFKYAADEFRYIHFEKNFAVTAISDGLVVTKIETIKGKQSYTLALHEPTGTSATPVPLTWDATAKTATLTNGMPAGNVTVSVEYFPQAEFAKSTDETLAPTAIADVPANTDAPIVTAGTVANIGTSEVKQGTLMYFVSQPTGNTDPDAPDYDTEGWTDKVPTADGLAEGKAFVWYYIKGAEPANIADRTDDNTRSDSDIKPLGTDGYVTLGAEPTYDVSLNQTGMADGEPAKWSAKSTNVTTAVNLGEADLKGVKKGETVTVTYTGSKKVIGVKAEKKAAAGIVNPVVGQIIGSDGKNYDANATLPSGVTAVAKIAYVGNDAETSTTYNHGLALALGDVSDKKAWCSQYQKTCLTTQYGSADAAKGDMAGIANTDALVNHTGHSHAAASAARDYNGGTHPMGTSEWFLPSAGQWDKMASAAGGYVKLRTNAGLQSDYYWSSTERDASYAWYFSSHNGDWLKDYKDMYSHRVRACLAF